MHSGDNRVKCKIRGVTVKWLVQLNYVILLDVYKSINNRFKIMF